MTTTLSPSDKRILLRARTDPQYYIERFLFLRSMDTERLVPLSPLAHRRRPPLFGPSA